MKLAIIIPAYNEEEAVAATIERTLAARDLIVRDSPVTDVEIIVVNDGSTDRTQRIASGYSRIRVTGFEHNRGYGAAIKHGFEQSDAELVAFLDADGTCDPRFFATLCRALTDENAAVAIGSRLGPHSRMPRIRRLGNRVYALTLSLLSNRVVTDTASGMRVIRRDALPRLYPLPDGLHFTPAMSARVLMDDRLKLVERAMPYEERVGESKLHVLKDGVRFFRTIFEMTLMWRPARLFTAAAVVCLALMTLLAMHPIEMWLRAGHLREDVIYRLLFCFFLGAVGVTLLSAGVVCRHLQTLLADARRDDRPATFVSTVLDRIYTARGLAPLAVAGVPLLVWLVGPGLWSWLTVGHVEQHWSRAVLAGLIAFGLVQMSTSVLIVNLLRFHESRRELSPRSVPALVQEVSKRDGAVITAASRPRRSPRAATAIPSINNATVGAASA